MAFEPSSRLGVLFVFFCVFLKNSCGSKLHGFSCSKGQFYYGTGKKIKRIQLFQELSQVQ